MSTEKIRCRSCGALNEITDFACRSCGGSLVGGGSDRWAEARERDRVLDADADAATERAATIQRLVVAGVGLAILGVVLAFTLTWYNRNYYLLGEPKYDNRTAAEWAEVMLESEDHYMRRRAALAIEAICERFNERTAYEVIPALKGALEDEDEEVRKRAKSALGKIERATGVK